MTAMPLGRRRFLALALPLARRGLRLLARPGALHHRGQAGAGAAGAGRRSCSCARSAWRAISTAARSCARRTATSSTSAATTGGASRSAACWRACWWSSLSQRLPGSNDLQRERRDRGRPQRHPGGQHPAPRRRPERAPCSCWPRRPSSSTGRGASAARTFTHRQAAAGRRPSRARSRRSATPSASSPTASRRCCSADRGRRDRGLREAEPPVTRAAAARVLRLRACSRSCRRSGPTCARTACAAAPRCAARAPIRSTAASRSPPPRWCCSSCCGRPC